MMSPTGRAAQIPEPIIAAVGKRAQESGRDVGGDDLFLLAILDLPDNVVAQGVLEAEGVTARRVLAEIRSPEDAPSDSPRGIRFPPAYNEMLGRAQGFTAALGDGTITAEHVLLFLIWDPTSLPAQALWRLGIRRVRLVRRLREMGVPVPSADVPEQRESEVGNACGSVVTRQTESSSTCENTFRPMCGGGSTTRTIAPGSAERLGFDMDALVRRGARADVGVDGRALPAAEVGHRAATTREAERERF
jgi:hypothetical protein